MPTYIFLYCGLFTFTVRYSLQTEHCQSKALTGEPKPKSFSYSLHTKTTIDFLSDIVTNYATALCVYVCLWYFEAAPCTLCTYMFHSGKVIALKEKCNGWKTFSISQYNSLVKSEANRCLPYQLAEFSVSCFFSIILYVFTDEPKLSV